MAIVALTNQLALVYVFMAVRASGFKASKRGVQIFAFQHRTVLRIDIFGDVAFRAFKLRMLAFQCPSGFSVIELLLRYWPPHDAEVHSVMLGMASRAIVAPGTRLDFQGVVATLLRKTTRDFFVAFQALDLGLSPAKNMTVGTLYRAIEIVVSLAERAGRNLSHHGGAH